MLKKTVATLAVAASAVGVGAASAAPAMAVGNDSGESVTNGNKAKQVYGNTTTHGAMSPNVAAIQGTANKLCAALPGKLNVGSVVGVVPITVQDLANSTNAQACTENSTQQDGDDPLSHILDEISVLSENAAVSARSDGHK